MALATLAVITKICEALLLVGAPVLMARLLVSVVRDTAGIEDEITPIIATGQTMVIHNG